MKRAGPFRCLCALVAVIGAMLALAAGAWAQTPDEAKTSPPEPATSANSATSVPSGLPDTPEGYTVDAATALSAADSDSKVQDRKEGLGDGELITASLSAEAVEVWEVSYFINGDKENLVVVDGNSGEVTESWTDSAVSWPMARGHEGQFGHLLNAPWVWGPLAGIFLLGLLDYRRLRKWVHLDLLVLLSFGVSQAFFNAAEIGISVPLYYPPLVYLLLRLLWIGFRGPGRPGGAGEGLRPSAPRWLLIGLAIGLIAVRIAGNVADSGVVDVGYAGVIGADKITDARPIYGVDSFPENNRTGDTYGPANYFAYVPFEEALPWSGAWDDLPAAHAAAIAFDLLTMLGLYALGRTVTRRRGEGLRGLGGESDTQGYSGAEPVGPEPTRGALFAPNRLNAPSAERKVPRPDAAEPAVVRESGANTDALEAAGTQEYLPEKEHPSSPGRIARLKARAAVFSPGRSENTLSLILVFGWLAYPYSTFALQSNSNDALISALLVWSLALFAVPVARGALLATAGLAKFAPLALIPLFAAGERGISLRAPEGSTSRLAALRPIALFTAAFIVASVLLIAHPAVDPGLAEFYDRTIKSQVDRVSPFSIWGQADLEWLHTLVKAGAIGLAVLVAFVPRTRSLTQVAALAGAVVIAIQITLEHWFYLYIPWFLPMLLLAMAVTAVAPRVAGDDEGDLELSPGSPG